ncbi:MAG TPA: phosphatidate cytidylyltransferase [Kofleriaceae bacterium]|nr:phosphatidate cytidylyltransferase [Kofleriaceae bacterium]
MARLGNLATRILVAVIAVPLILLLLFQSHHELLWAVIFAASLVTMYELFAMTLPARPDRVAALVLGALAAAGFYWLPARFVPHTTAFLFAFAGPALYYLFRPGDILTAAERLAFTVFGIIYGGISFAFIALIKRDFGAVGGDMIVLVLATAWLSDTGGYFAGKFLGKRKLYPAVSPNKTWAGAIGGTIAALAGGFVMQGWRLKGLAVVDVVVLTGVGSVLGQLGDLVESLIKRSRGVKDSGAILPGHGGLLDRLDAVLFIAPWFYLYATYRAGVMP